MRLQQILFFREPGFNLKDIQKVLAQNDFDNIKALYAHRGTFEKDIARKNSLIDKTIQNLRGKQVIKDEELYYGFNSTRQKEYEQYIVKSHGTAVEALLMESKRRTEKWDTEAWDNVKKQGDVIHKALAAAIERGLKPDSDEVQKIIHEHYQITNKFYTVTKEVYIGLTALYAEHPDFKKFFDVHHPKMIEFIGEAMRFYANKHL